MRLLLALAGLLFYAGIFAVFYRVLAYFQGIEGFGDILARKLLSLALVTFFAILIFSSILTALSSLYLSRDLPLVHAAPVPIEEIFMARLQGNPIPLVHRIWITLSFALVAGINMLDVCWPMRLGVKRLSQMDA